MRLLLCGLLLAAGLTTACEPAGGGCRAAAAPAGVVEVAPKPKPKKSAGRKASNCTKATSTVWKGFKPHRGDIKTNGLPGAQRRFYTWDHTHGDIEVWDRGGKHLGSMDAADGSMTKGPVKGRTIDV